MPHAALLALSTRLNLSGFCILCEVWKVSLFILGLLLLIHERMAQHKLVMSLLEVLRLSEFPLARKLRCLCWMTRRPPELSCCVVAATPQNGS